MLGTGRVIRGQWTLLLLRSPGAQPMPCGVLLLDPTTDRLYVRLSKDLVNLDPDVALIWKFLEADLIDKATELGGVNVLRWLEDEGSNTVSVSDRRELEMGRPELALDELFLRYLKSPMETPDRESGVEPERVFTASEIAAAYEKLPISRIAGIQALKLLDDARVDLQALDQVLAKDPALSAHLIRLGNLGSVSRGGEVRRVSQALARIGTDQAKLHIWGLCMKNLYTSPHLQQIWDHSLFTVSVTAELCEQIRYSDAAGANLIAMLHDIGQLVFSALGPSYQNSRAKLLARGLYPVEAERRLCGVTHAEVGADLLSSWQFPTDLIEAVRYHHRPSKCKSLLASLVYCAECWTDRGEDIYNPVEHHYAIDLLGLQGRTLHLGTRHKPDLDLLRYAA
jgi:putative nucleotidyltransferase with HDIG domain